MLIGRFAAATMRRARHHTLIFHRVLQSADPMMPGEPTADWFRQLVVTLADHFEIIRLSEAIERAHEGRLNGRTLSITFDDGYADNFSVALPILEQANVPATFFVASGFLNGGRMWNDSIIESFRRFESVPDEADLPAEAVGSLNDWPARRAAARATILAWKHLAPDERQDKVDRLARHAPALPEDLMMTSEQLRGMAASSSAAIGGHTRSHPILAALSTEQAGQEIEQGKRDIEQIIGQPLALFAYPNGKLGDDYRQQHADIVAEVGFSAAVATDWGTLDASTDRYHIPRFTPWHTNLNRFIVDMARCHHGMI